MVNLPIRCRSGLLTLGSCLTLASVVAEESSTAKPKCGVYLAPSSIPGSGLGMYAGDREYKKGETVTGGDTVIPIIEHEWNTELLSIDYNFLWDEYTWYVGQQRYHVPSYTSSHLFTCFCVKEW